MLAACLRLHKGKKKCSHGCKQSDYDRTKVRKNVHMGANSLLATAEEREKSAHQVQVLPGYAHGNTAPVVGLRGKRRGVVHVHHDEGALSVAVGKRTGCVTCCSKPNQWILVALGWKSLSSLGPEESSCELVRSAGLEPTGWRGCVPRQML